MFFNFSIFYFMSFLLGTLSFFFWGSTFFSVFMRQMLIIDWELFEMNSVVLTYSIIMDQVSCSFLAVVFLISSAVLYYSHEYMAHEPMKNSFSYIVFLFVMSMMFLIISPSLVSVILGWDGLGLVSYLLVIYYQNYKSYSAGTLTCLTNRLGDSALLVSMGFLFSYGSLDFIYMLSMMSQELFIAGVFIILAAMTKSAQIPFSSWLPAAMAAPTPVSALVHSSTLVTAGVFLVLRFFPLVSSFSMTKALFVFGVLTMMMSSFAALYETDLKKIIALSTLSQLGLMMMSLGVGYYILAYFHLLTHALFKAALFLCAGSIIHSMEGSQDLRQLTGVTSVMPITSSCLLICSLSLSGFPFLSAFFSKDKIIEESLSNGGSIMWLSLFIMSVALTALYSFRLLFYTSVFSNESAYSKTHDSSVMTKSMLVLTMGGIVGGSFLSWVLFSSSYDNLYILYKVSILLFLLLGVILGLYIKFSKVSIISFFSSMMWFLVSLSTKASSSMALYYGKQVMKTWDAGWNEVVGPQGVKKELMNLYSSSESINFLSFKIILMISFMLFSMMFFLY